jgi:hypothetical protein
MQYPPPPDFKLEMKRLRRSGFAGNRSAGRSYAARCEPQRIANRHDRS